jgi:hypothetical protein
MGAGTDYNMDTEKDTDTGRNTIIDMDMDPADIYAMGLIPQGNLFKGVGPRITLSRGVSYPV